jgi:pullulanase/glycogen debranching enzyme
VPTVDLSYDTALGSFPSSEQTLFRVFAPNAKELHIHHGRNIGDLGGTLAAAEVESGLWEAAVPGNLHGHFYTLSVEPKERFGLREEDFRAILDPYALACYDTTSTGIILDRSELPTVKEIYSPPAPRDLIILEGHLRDLLGLSSKGPERPTYDAFCRWLREEDNYLCRLGVNALELQPLQEYEDSNGGGYHWGYMPVNYFSPSGAYAIHRECASQVADFAALVEACHARGLAVILDVVYNHLGNPNPLLCLGGHSFFRTNSAGELSNCSGCGNDLRTEAPMVRKLILDSLVHLLRTYGVDGFRFDLAELIDEKTRGAIEDTLHRIRPNVILIAEPWSFRGHCAENLRETTWSSWNDDFRDSVRGYVRGEGGRDGLKYFLGGSVGKRNRLPQQSVNYTASHDDRTWIDSITENANFDGTNPTDLDLRRTRLMFAILFCCNGIPLLAQGQDFCHSKGGVANTYRDGARNELLRDRLGQFDGLHRYVVDWIHLRRSELGKLLRLGTATGSGFFLHFEANGSSCALGTLYNAAGEGRLLFLCNPERHAVRFDLRGLLGREQFRPIANGEHFYAFPPNHTLQEFQELEAVDCELWSLEGPFS